MNNKSINRNVRTLTLSLCLGVIFAFAHVGVGKAQEKAQEQDHGKQLEALVNRLDAAKDTEKAGIADQLDEAMHKAANELYQSALKAIKAGDSVQLQKFEEQVKGFEKTLNGLEPRLKNIAPKEKSGSISEPAAGGKVAGGWPMWEKIGDFFISPARAEIAAILLQAPITAAAQTSAAWATFQQCWDAAKNPWWLRIWRRLQCSIALAHRLA